MIARRRCLTGDDPDYLLIYATCALWSLLLGTLTPSAMSTVPTVQTIISVLMMVSGAASVVCVYGVYTGDKLGLERTALLGVLVGLLAYAITQLPLAIVYLLAGNHDRVALAVFAWLPVLFLNRRRRFLNRRREQVSALAHLHDGDDR